MSFYVTTPIYYVNAAPHLGHAYTGICTDIVARHMRQRGEDVFFLTGTDEHGEPVALAAEREGVAPQELADRNAVRFRELMPRLGIANDFFIRTSDAGHVERVQEILTRVRDRGHVYRGLYEGWYCPRCADFKTEAEIGPGTTCLIHKVPLVREREENWFFRLSSFQEPLERLYAERPDFVLPRHRFNEARSFIGQGLQDVSLSRARLSWGVPVPWEPEHVFYVWWDALLNYVTALGYAREGEDLTERFWPATFHVIGKDILKFHTVYWPALLLAAGLALPEHVFVHGFLLSPAADGDGDGDGSAAEGAGELEKMSKSRGNVIDPFAIVDTFGTDALRFYCAREVVFGQDGPVSEATFATRYESELANELGNLASRTLSMVVRYRDGRIPDVAPDPALGADFADLPERVCGLLDGFALTAALDEVWQRVRRLNRYVEEQAPWKLAKDPEAADRLDAVLAGLAEGLRVVGVLLHAYLPDSTTRLLEALGAPDTSVAAARFGAGPRGAVGALPPLFPEAVIDAHTHLDVCEPPDDELVAAAVAAGVTRMLTVGTDGASCRRALAAAEAFPQVFAAVGRHPNAAQGFDGADLAELRALAEHERCAAIGETGLDFYRDRAPHADQARAFEAQIALAAETGKPLVIHTREADEPTLATLRAQADGVTVVLHCFSMPDRLEEVLDRGWFVSFAGNVTYPKNVALADAAARVPADRLLVETDAPYLTPQAVRRERNQPAHVAHTARFVAERRGVALPELERELERTAARVFGW